MDEPCSLNTHTTTPPPPQSHQWFSLYFSNIIKALLAIFYMKQGNKCMNSFKHVTSSIKGLNFCALLSSLYAIAIPEPNPAFLSSQISPGSRWEVFRCIAMDYKAESFLRNRGPTIFKLKATHLKSHLCAFCQPETLKENFHLYLSSGTEWNKHYIPIKESSNKKIPKHDTFTSFCTFLSVRHIYFNKRSQAIIIGCCK